MGVSWLVYLSIDKVANRRCEFDSGCRQRSDEALIYDNPDGRVLFDIAARPEVFDECFDVLACERPPVVVRDMSAGGNPGSGEQEHSPTDARDNTTIHPRDERVNFGVLDDGPRITARHDQCVESSSIEFSELIAHLNAQS